MQHKHIASISTDVRIDLTNQPIATIQPHAIVIDNELGAHLVIWHVTALTTTDRQALAKPNAVPVAVAAGNGATPFYPIPSTSLAQSYHQLITAIGGLTFEQLEDALAKKKPLITAFLTAHAMPAVIHIYNCPADQVNDQQLTRTAPSLYRKYKLFGNDACSGFMFVHKASDGCGADDVNQPIMTTTIHSHHATKVLVATHRLFESSIAVPNHQLRMFGFNCANLTES